MAQFLAEEVNDAHSAGVKWVACPGPEFDRLVGYTDRFIFVVAETRQLIVAPQLANGFEIRHSVLADGNPVLAAGELEVIHGAGLKYVTDLTSKSGHYDPRGACLDLVVELLIGLGYHVPDDAVRPYAGD